MHRRLTKGLKRRSLAVGCAAGCLLVVVAPSVWAETSKSRVGYRAHGRYAKPAPPSQHQQPVAGSPFSRAGTAIGSVPRTQQKYYRVLPPYASNTEPFRSNPHYPSGQKIDPRALPHVGAVRYVTVLPQPAVYLPVGTVYQSPADVLRANPQPIAPPLPAATTPAGAPIYVVVQQPPAPTVVPPAPSPATAAPQPAEPRPPRGPGELRFEVQPADAQVFLDDRLLGDGAAVSGQAEALVLDAGVYMLEVSHPDHRSERLFFGVYSDTGVRVEVDLSRADGRRRSWVDSDS